MISDNRQVGLAWLRRFPPGVRASIHDACVNNSLPAILSLEESQHKRPGYAIGDVINQNAGVDARSGNPAEWYLHALAGFDMVILSARMAGWDDDKVQELYQTIYPEIPEQTAEELAEGSVPDTTGWFEESVNFIVGDENPTLFPMLCHRIGKRSSEMEAQLVAASVAAHHTVENEDKGGPGAGVSPVDALLALGGPGMLEDDERGFAKHLLKMAIRGGPGVLRVIDGEDINATDLDALEEEADAGGPLDEILDIGGRRRRRRRGRGRGRGRGRKVLRFARKARSFMKRKPIFRKLLKGAIGLAAPRLGNLINAVTGGPAEVSAAIADMEKLIGKEAATRVLRRAS